MNKILRFSFVALMAIVGGGNLFAEDIIWSEDFSSFAANDVPEGGTYSYACTGTTKVYNDALAGGTAPELLIQKSNQTFTVTIPLNGKSGEMTLSYLANYDRLSVSSSTTGVTIGEKKNSGSSYTWPITVPAGTESITIEFKNTTNSNVRFDNAKLYQGDAKKAAGLSWGTASRTVTIGSEENVFPTLTNENNLTVTYSSSETGVATIDASGVVTLVAAGTTVISAAFAGNDEFEAQTISYTLTVNAKSSDDPSTEASEITVAKALEIINALDNGNSTTEVYKVKGYVVGNPEFQRKSDETLYGNVNLYIADEKGGTATLYVFRGKNFDNANFTEETISSIKADDAVVFQGKLQKYVKNDAVTPELTNGYLISVNGSTTGISAVKAQTSDAPIFNLSGQRVEKAVKGIYIQNGKKFVVK